MAHHPDRCALDSKRTYRTYEQAAAVAASLEEPGRPYWCPTAGGYHITRQSAAENARRVADRTPARTTPARTHDYIPAGDVPADHNGHRPCICGRARVNRAHGVSAWSDEVRALESRRLGERGDR